MKRYNAHEALQILEDEGFFSHADIAIQPPGDVLESEEDSGDEADNDPNHLSGNQLLANAEIHIDYSDGSTFDTIDVQMDKECDESEEEPKQPDDSPATATSSRGTTAARGASNKTVTSSDADTED